MTPIDKPASPSGSAPGAVGRTFTVLDVLARRRKVSFTELEQSCPGMAKATLIRLLRSLQSAGQVEKDKSGYYVLGPDCFRFARSVLELVSRGELVTPALTMLADATGESAAYFELDGRQVKLLNKVEMPNSFHYIPVGGKAGRLHIHVFALVILAFSNDPFTRRMLAGEKRAEEAARNRARTTCDRIRSEGLYVGPEEPGAPISRVVAPVLGSDGIARGAIGITLLGERVAKKRLAECRRHVLEAAALAGEHILGNGGSS